LEANGMQSGSLNHLDPVAVVQRLFREKLEIDVPSVETDLLDGGLLDSLAFVELAVQIERAFGITLSFESLEIDHFRTIGSIAEFVSNQLRGCHGSDSTVPIQ
jgi:acyl carrier protein